MKYTGNYEVYIDFINYALKNKIDIISGASVLHIGDDKYEFFLSHRGGCDCFRKCLIYKENGEIKHKIKKTGDWMCLD